MYAEYYDPQWQHWNATERAWKKKETDLHLVVLALGSYMDNLEVSYKKLPHIVLDQPFDRSKIWLINQRTKLITYQITVSKEVPIGNHNAWHLITSVTRVVEPSCSDTINPFLIPKPLYHMKAVW